MKSMGITARRIAADIDVLACRISDAHQWREVSPQSGLHCAAWILLRPEAGH